MVGAGTAGAAAAALLAERGLSVLCLERGSLERAGERWVNGVPEWTFRESGIEPPEGAELRGAGHAFHLVGGWGPRRVVVRDHRVLEVDMRLLVARLQQRARRAGVELLEGVSVHGLSGRTLATSIGDVSARWFVDASGLSGARLLDQPRVASDDLCSAAQEVRSVTDPARAHEFFERHAVPPRETLCFTGIAGGFSIVNLRLDDEGISILTGSIAANGHASGSALIADLVAKQPWIGPRLFGGARAIPLRRPFDRLARGNVALIGDAACQVFSAHGSGIGAGLVAARVLADQLTEHASLEAYAVSWHRRYGGLFAGYDAFRRLSQTLAPHEIEHMLDSGLLDDWGARAGLEQRLPSLGRDALVRVGSFGRGLSKNGALGRRIAVALGRMAAARALYATYPRRPERLPAWSRRVARVLGVQPDV